MNFFLQLLPLSNLKFGNFWIFHQFSSKSFETLSLKTSIHKQNIVEVTFFSKLQIGGVIQDGATNHCFILSSLTEPILNRFEHINSFWTCKVIFFHISPTENNLI
jgi:hypothetical protein